MKIDKLRKWLLGWCPKEVLISKEKAPITQSLLRPTHLATRLSLTAAAVVMMIIIYVGFTQEYVLYVVFPPLYGLAYFVVSSWVRARQTASRIRVLSAFSLLGLVPVAYVVWRAVSPTLSPSFIWVYVVMIQVSVLIVEQVYTLLKGKLIPDRIRHLNLLIVVIPGIISAVAIFSGVRAHGDTALALFSLVPISSFAINRIKRRKSPYPQRDSSRSSSPESSRGWSHEREKGG